MFIIYCTISNPFLVENILSPIYNKNMKVLRYKFGTISYSVKNSLQTLSGLRMLFFVVSIMYANAVNIASNKIKTSSTPHF